MLTRCSLLAPRSRCSWCARDSCTQELASLHDAGFPKAASQSAQRASVNEDTILILTLQVIPAYKAGQFTQSPPSMDYLLLGHLTLLTALKLLQAARARCSSI
jgi:hypothetical protein